MFVVRNTEVADHHLNVFFATRHVSLRRALDQITRERVGGSIREALTALRVFGTSAPRLAVAALNPHGGEGGAFGDEEIEHIGPACEDARAEGLDVAGPIPADSVFHHGLAGRYDGVLSLYRDQGHIAAKPYDFDGTISVTVGLPILRTSVDHGTAFDIAARAGPTRARCGRPTSPVWSTARSCRRSARSTAPEPPIRLRSTSAKHHRRRRRIWGFRARRSR